MVTGSVVCLIPATPALRSLQQSMIVYVSRNERVNLQTSTESESTITGELKEAEHKGENDMVESRGELNYPALFQINATTLLTYPVDANLQHEFFTVLEF